MAQGNETILLVEDELLVRNLTRDSLQRNGYTVLEAKGGTDALHLAAQHHNPIELLLTDVVMPHMSGPELAGQLAVLHPETRVMYISGYTDKALGQQDILDDNFVFLQKPFTPNSLVQKIRSVLDKGNS